MQPGGAADQDGRIMKGDTFSELPFLGSDILAEFILTNVKSPYSMEIKFTVNSFHATGPFQ